MGRRRFPEFKSTRELVRFIDDAKTDLSQYDLTTIGDPVDIEIDTDLTEVRVLLRAKRPRT